MVTPVSLPSFKFLAGDSFGIDWGQIADEASGGLSQTATVQDPVWVMEYRFAGWFSQADLGEFTAFLDGLEGVAIPFKAFDPRRRVPLIHYGADGEPVASGSPWGAPRLVSIDRANSRLVTENWTPGHLASVRDYLEFTDDSGRVHLHRVAKASVANQSGDLTLDVVFRPGRNIVVSDPTLTIRDAGCIAKAVRPDPNAISRTVDRGSPFVLRGRQSHYSVLG